ncbi:hypothetical protein [Myroides indicus]|uniref:Uncharacterized protein n=1 Tax=Myroides indicus TaxID=1323422 RepID=A0A4R7EQM3_9FLAO|nr:hypothetical protein [Myroides indicus]TDS55232.1 hypothetical protein C8P70_1233 [Myroides indicus]
MKICFSDIRDVFLSIKRKSYDRKYANEIANAYIYEENQNIFFKDDMYDNYGFIFQFLSSEQFFISDNEFRNLIDSISYISEDKMEPKEIKKILYKKQIDELKRKYKNKVISKDIYNAQITKYLN